MIIENSPKKIYLVRHGETEWTKSGQHTGLTDKPLTEQGKHEAALLKRHLMHIPFTKVLTSPLKRALETCELAGFSKQLEIDPNLVEWNYGDYEGLTYAEITKQRPNWNLFNDGVPNGETCEQISARADRVLHKIAKIDGNVALFSSGHILRVLTARFLGHSVSMGRNFLLFPASISILSYARKDPVVQLWNLNIFGDPLKPSE
jgi:broad specificity phosphatase PhoE